MRHRRVLLLIGSWLVTGTTGSPVTPPDSAAAVTRPRRPSMKATDPLHTTSTSQEPLQSFQNGLDSKRVNESVRKRSLHSMHPPYLPNDRRYPQQRRLQGGGYDNVDLTSVEAGFAFGLLLLFLLLLLLCCCCCCGGGCSLWDCVALACLWEMCCDPDCNPGGDVVSGFDML